LHLIDTTGPGGAETVFIQLADNIRSRNAKSLVVIRGPGWVEDNLRSCGLEPFIINVHGSFEIRFLLKLVKLIKQEKVDVVQSHLLGSNVYAAMAGILTRTPVVATYHGMVDINPNERFKWLKNVAMKCGIKRFVAVSNRLLKNIESQNLLVPDKSTVIYNGVDIEKYGVERKKPSTLDSRQTIKELLALPEEATMIGSLGNIRSAKAYDVLIRAGEIVIKICPNVHFIIAGHMKEPLMSQLEQLVEELELKSRFHFIGFCNDSAKFLSQMDFFCLSSSSEGFSISTIEAMASVLPVVVTKCGGPEEIIIDSSMGSMVQTGNPQELANELIRLIENPEQASSLAVNARKRVENAFSLDKMVDSYNEIYKNILEPRT